MVKIAKLFNDRFDSVMHTDDGVSLCCNECAATFKIPSAVDAIRRGDAEDGYTEDVMDFVERVVGHLDECLPSPADDRQH